MGLVIDTSALVDIERLAGADGGGASAWAILIARIGDQPAALPAIAYAEVLAGVELADTVKRAAARRARLEALTDHVGIRGFRCGGCSGVGAVVRDAPAIRSDDPRKRSGGRGDRETPRLWRARRSRRREALSHGGGTRRDDNQRRHLSSRDANGMPCAVDHDQRAVRLLRGREFGIRRRAAFRGPSFFRAPHMKLAFAL